MKRGRMLSVRVLESLVALYKVFKARVKMDLREVILRYVTNSRVTTNRIIYQLVKHGYIRTLNPTIDSKIIENVVRALTELRSRKGISKGPYVGFLIASTVETVLNRYDSIDWEITEKGLRYLRRKLSELSLSLEHIDKLPPLVALLEVRRRIEMKFTELESSILKQRNLFGQPILLDDVSAARTFIIKAFNVLYPSSERVEPKAGFAISFARDEDAVANFLINKDFGGKSLWKILNTEYVNPLVTNYRNYLIMYGVSMLYPESRNKIIEFVKNSSNWPRLAEIGRAESIDKYLEASIRSGYIIDRSGILEFEDPFLIHKNRPRSVIEYLNEIYFANSIVATGLLAFGRVSKAKSYQLNIKKAVSCTTATLLWQSTYSYPIPIIRKSENKIDPVEWYKELKKVKRPGVTLTFPRVMQELDKSIAIKVLETYIDEFIRLLIEGKIIYTIKDPKANYEVLVPHGIAIKIFNVFRENKDRHNHIANLIHAFKRLLSESKSTGPLIERHEVEKVLNEVFGGRKEAVLHKLRSEGIIIEVGEHFVLTPYDLPAVYLDLLKGPSSLVHAQGYIVNLLRIASMLKDNIRERFMQLLTELDRYGQVPLRDFTDVAIVGIDAIHYMKGWGVIEIDTSDPDNPIIRLSSDFSGVKYDAKFIIRALKEILGWKVIVEDRLTYNEAKGELKEHIEGKDSCEVFESINELSNIEIGEPPYEEKEYEKTD